MRYFVVNYYRKPNGQMDEVVSIAKRIRIRDLQSAAVILDFKLKSVVKCSMDGVVVPKNWQRIRDFYHQHYSQVIQDLEKKHIETTNTD
jgi:hypothetical protein